MNRNLLKNVVMNSKCFYNRIIKNLRVMPPLSPIPLIPYTLPHPFKPHKNNNRLN